VREIGTPGVGRSAALRDHRHLRPADRTVPLKGRPAVGQSNGLGILDFSIVPTPHAQPFAGALSLASREGTGAVVGAFQLGPTRRRIERKLPGFRHGGKVLGGPTRGLNTGSKDLDFFLEGREPSWTSYASGLSVEQESIHCVLRRALPLLAGVGEVVARAALEVRVTSGGAEEFADSLVASGAAKPGASSSELSLGVTDLHPVGVPDPVSLRADLSALETKAVVDHFPRDHADHPVGLAEIVGVLEPRPQGVPAGKDDPPLPVAPKVVVVPSVPWDPPISSTLGGATGMVEGGSTAAPTAGEAAASSAAQAAAAIASGVIRRRTARYQLQDIGTTSPPPRSALACQHTKPCTA
jgi:hypothetical protein